MTFSTVLHCLAASAVLGSGFAQAGPSQLHERQNRYVAITNLTFTGTMPVRREIKDCYNDKIFTDLFLQALAALQATNQNSDLSYYQLAGIHGRPYKAWNGVTGGNNNGGYCTHGDVLFGTWHRPYLAVYEQALFAQANQIASRYPSNLQAQYRAKAATFRLPYWDYLADPTLPPQIFSQTTYSITAPSGQQQTIPNPMYQYRYNPVVAADQATAGQPVTIRNSVSAVSSAITRDVRNQLCDAAYTMFTTYDDYVYFSSDAVSHTQPGKSLSLEGLHGTIHVDIGGNMGSVPIAAFDPIFWLHHCNIDRCMAIWQAMHYNSWFTTSYPSTGTFGIRTSTPQNGGSPLVPFHSNDNTYWTSDTARNVANFGYTYPELQGPNGQVLGGEAQKNNVLTKINALYAKCSPGKVIQAAQGLAPVNNVPQPVPQQPQPQQPQQPQPQQPQQPQIIQGIPIQQQPQQPPRPQVIQGIPNFGFQLNLPNLPTPNIPQGFNPFPALPPQQQGGLRFPLFQRRKAKRNIERRQLTKDNLCSDTVKKYLSKIMVNGDSTSLPSFQVEVKVMSNACQESFKTCAFFGDVPKDTDSFSTAANLVGCYGVFTNPDNTDGTLKFGSISLTTALIEKVTCGGIADLKEATVQAYLAKNLNWGTVALSKGVQDVTKLDGFKVRVTNFVANVTSQEITGQKTLDKVTDAKPGGLKQGETFVIEVAKPVVPPPTPDYGGGGYGDGGYGGGY